MTNLRVKRLMVCLSYLKWKWSIVLPILLLILLTVSRRRSRGKPWITKEVSKARRKKYQLWKKYQETKDYNIYVRYKKQLNFTTREIKAKKSFVKKVADNNKLDPKSYHSYVRSKTKTKDRIGPLVDETGLVVTSDKEAADFLKCIFYFNIYRRR